MTDASGNPVPNTAVNFTADTPRLSPTTARQPS
ncbi:hypothetical protein [Hafnia alvei]